MRTAFLHWYVVVVVLACCICACNTPCKTYEPCCGKHRTTAEFHMYHVPFGIGPDNLTHWIEYDEDTIFTGYKRFVALQEEADSFVWHIGAGVYHGKEVQLGGFPQGETVPVTLTVYDSEASSCFADDDGIDTKTRTLYTPITGDIEPFYGKYRGFLASNPLEEFTIEIYLTPVPNIWGGITQRLAIYNYDQNNCLFVDSVGTPPYGSYLQGFFGSPYLYDNPCRVRNGIMTIDPAQRNKITFLFNLNVIDPGVYEYKFTGFRIP